MLDPRNTEYFPSTSSKGIRKSPLIKSIDVTLANHVIFWPRETATLLKSNLRYFYREKSTFEKFDAGLKLRIIFYTRKTIKNRRKNFRVIYTLIKTIKHSWRVGAKIMRQSKQVLKKVQLQNTKKEGRARLFFGFNTQN